MATYKELTDQLLETYKFHVCESYPVKVYDDGADLYNGEWVRFDYDDYDPVVVFKTREEAEAYVVAHAKENS